jgi:DNA-binding IclR family transcriptional regulator
LFGVQPTARRIAQVLEVLEDGKWHRLEEIRERMKLNEGQTLQIVSFLEEYQFVTSKEKRKMVRLRKAVRKFLTQSVTP